MGVKNHASAIRIKDQESNESSVLGWVRGWRGLVCMYIYIYALSFYFVCLFVYLDFV